MNASAFGVIAVGIFGANIGSFLNVVIFRLPRGLSITKPPRSFCPRCESPIRLIHNLPIIGWFLLRGKCAACRQPISAIYPTIEALTALTFIIVWDVLFVAKLMPAVMGPEFDWPILIAWLALFACLLAISAMDIESYMIDVRVLNLAMVLGILGHAVWWFYRGAVFAGPFLTGQDGSAGFIPTLGQRVVPRNLIDTLPPAISISACAGGITWVVTMLVVHLVGRRNAASAEIPSDESETDGNDPSVDQTAYLSGGADGFRPIPVLMLVCVILVIAGWQIAQASELVSVGLEACRGMLGGVALMAAVVVSSLDPREADSQIIEEIESERPEARRMALREFAHFLPAIVVGLGLFLYFRSTQRLDAPLSAWFGPEEGAPLWSALGGSLYAGAGLVLGAAIGWFVRIVGTLAFGKEAFGSGDIFILAAIGAALGFWGAFFSFFLSVFLALLGVVLTLLSKRSRALPFGPWLTLGAVVYLWIGPAITSYFAEPCWLIWDLVVRSVGAAS